MPDSPFDLAGRVALVTGAYRGLGFAIARGLAQAGATVILNGRKPAELAEAAGKLVADGLAADVATFDVTRRDAVHAAVAAVVARHGAVDILVNNAGIQRRAPFVEFTQQDWDDIVATNLTAPFVVSQAVLPGMIARKYGKPLWDLDLLDFTDGTTSTHDPDGADEFNVKPQALALFMQGVADLIRRSERRVEKVTFLYNGDIFSKTFIQRLEPS